MRLWQNKKWMPLLMGLTILAIAAFQVYWLAQAYEREERTLDMRTNYLFREALFQLQGNKIPLERLGDSNQILLRRSVDKVTATRLRSQGGKVVNLANILVRKVQDSGNTAIIIRGKDTLPMFGEGARRRGRLMQFLFDVDSVQDSVRIAEVQALVAKRFGEQRINLPFSVGRIATPAKEEPALHQVTLGFTKPITYQLTLEDKPTYLLKKIGVPILFSVFLVAFTCLSFMLLYRNALHQKRLADIKNEFISNITHELKTPIATVSVAIEALRRMNGEATAERAREYLDISAHELQRLSMLVDKVLKLSMFEKKEVALHYEPLHWQAVVEEVLQSMRLQFENKGAQVTLHAEGDTHLSGDRLHLVSVVYNLLDNALKYSSGPPRIDVRLKGEDHAVTLSVRDRGIGIPQAYHEKVFEKFFRVPTGNVHNAKGYGLGLSYVAHVVQKHGGTIQLQSSDAGSTFVVTLPRQQKVVREVQWEKEAEQKA